MLTDLPKRNCCFFFFINTTSHEYLHLVKFKKRRDHSSTACQVHFVYIAYSPMAKSLLITSSLLSAEVSFLQK